MRPAVTSSCARKGAPLEPFVCTVKPFLRCGLRFVCGDGQTITCTSRAQKTGRRLQYVSSQTCVCPYRRLTSHASILFGDVGWKNRARRGELFSKRSVSPKPPSLDNRRLSRGALVSNSTRANSSRTGWPRFRRSLQSIQNRFGSPHFLQEETGWQPCVAHPPHSVLDVSWVEDNVVGYIRKCLRETLHVVQNFLWRTSTCEHSR